jgi:hypothetical protein
VDIAAAADGIPRSAKNSSMSDRCGPPSSSRLEAHSEVDAITTFLLRREPVVEIVPRRVIGVGGQEVRLSPMWKTRFALREKSRVQMTYGAVAACKKRETES